jgi:hypothetical protein
VEKCQIGDSAAIFARALSMYRENPRRQDHKAALESAFEILRSPTKAPVKAQDSENIMSEIIRELGLLHDPRYAPVPLNLVLCARNQQDPVHRAIGLALVGRNRISWAPSEANDLFVEAGSVARALNPSLKAKTLAQIAATWSQIDPELAKGLLVEAVETCRQLDDFTKSVALAEVAKGYILVGEAAQAVEVAAQIQGDRDSHYMELISTFTEQGAKTPFLEALPRLCISRATAWACVAAIAILWPEAKTDIASALASWAPKTA